MQALQPMKSSSQYLMLVAVSLNGRRIVWHWRSATAGRILLAMGFDHTDFSVVVKKRASPPKQWRWEIYRAGRNNPIESSSVNFETVEAANRAGKEALKKFLTQFLV
jgi:hypothetical protein